MAQNPATSLFIIISNTINRSNTTILTTTTLTPTITIQERIRISIRPVALVVDPGI